MSTPDEKKAGDIKLGAYSPNSKHVILKWQPPEFNSRLGFVTPGFVTPGGGSRQTDFFRLARGSQPGSRHMLGISLGI